MEVFKQLFYLAVCLFPVTVFSQVYMKNNEFISIPDELYLNVGNYSHQTGGKINLGGGMIIKDNWKNISGSSDVFTAPSNGTLIFQGVGLQTISQSNNFVNVELKNSVNLSGTINIAGVIDLNDNQITGTGSLSLLAGATAATSHPDGLDGNLHNTGSISVDTQSEYFFEGGQDQQTGSLMSQHFDNFIIEKTPGSFVTLTSSGLTQINNTLDIRSGSLIVNSNAQLTVDGPTIIENSQGLILKSDDDGSASFIDNGIINGNGTAIVEKYLSTSNAYGWTVSSPVENQSQSVFAGHINTYFYNPLTAVWNVFTGGSLEIMKGYWTKFSTDKTLRFESGLNTGDIVFTDFFRTVAYGQGNNGWNFIGNPYPSAISWDAVETLSENVSLNNSFLETTKLNNAVYISNNAGGYMAYINGIGLTGFEDGVIPPTTAFWVQINNNYGYSYSPVPDAQLVLNNSVRLHQTVDLGNKKALPDNVLRLVLSNDSLFDESIIRLAIGATMQYDPAFDAAKMFSQNTDVPQLYSIIANDEKLSINAIGYNPTLHLTVPLGYKSQSDHMLHLTAGNLGSFDAGISVSLEDRKEDIMHDLNADDTYEFTSEVNEDNTRFVLHFNYINTSIDNNPNVAVNSSSIYTYDNILYVNQTQELSVVRVFNLLGQEIYRSELNSSGLHKINLNVTGGHYIVNVMSSQNNVTQKVFLY